MGPLPGRANDRTRKGQGHDRRPPGGRDRVQLAALAATLTSQQVTQNRADARGGEPAAASRLALSLNNLSIRLGDLGRPEDALAAIEEAVTIRRELAAARPDAFRPDLASSLTSLFADLAARQPDDYLHELEQSLQVAAWFERSEDLSDTSPQEQEPKA